MDPNQQQYQPPLGNSYDFILNPQKPPKPKKFGFSGGSNFGLTLGVIIGGAVLFMIIIAVVLSMFSGGGSNSSVNMTGIAQSQQELIRVADQGVKGAVRQTTRNLAVTVQYSMITQQKQTVAYLGRIGTNVDPKQLALKQNATTDQRLASAKATSTFDETFAEIMQNELTVYANNLKQLYNTATGENEKLYV
jgi:hypothetical protein